MKTAIVLDWMVNYEVPNGRRANAGMLSESDVYACRFVSEENRRFLGTAGAYLTLVADAFGEALSTFVRPLPLAIEH